MATTPLPRDFAPGTRHAFEPEFTGPPPRPIPERLDQGPYARRRRAGAVALAAGGVACVLLSRADGVEVLARYVLPLAYLQWIGRAVLALAGVAIVALAMRTGPFRYVREGVPIAARVLELVKTPTAMVNGAPSFHAFIAAVAFRHPETGELMQTHIRTERFSSSRKEAYDVPFKVGDDVTAVYLPGRLQSTLQLYAFLDLSPDVNLSAPGRKRESPLETALLLAAIPAFFVAMFANLYAFGRYHPVDFDYRRALMPMVAGGLLLGGGLYAGLLLSHRAEQRALRSRAAAALASGGAVETGTPFLGRGLYGWFLRVVLALGALVLGAGTVLCWCFIANARLDRSPARTVPATIERRLMKTHALIFREYQLEYRLAGSSETHRMLTTPEHLGICRGTDALARIRAGRFGWPWVETVSPR
jgi:hypothetical protein